MEGRHTYSLVLAAVTLCGVGSTFPGTRLQAQTVYNPATDFSATSNPNGVWSYGYANTGSIASLSSTFTLFTSAGTWNGRTGLDRWNRPLSYPNDYPLVFKNTTASSIDYGGGLVVAAGQFGMIGGPEGIVANTRLTLPATGQYSLSATFTRLQSPASHVDVWIVIGGSITPINATIYDVNASASVSNYLFSATAGTTVDFVVGPNTGGASAMSNDTTSLVATVTAVPEPSTYAALVGLAVLGCAAWRRRR